jgi:hypothetical protein
MTAAGTTERVLTTATGTVLGAAFGALARIRPAAKPLHPKGEQVLGTLHRTGAAGKWGVDWLERPGTDRVLIRFSRATGLPPALPDILGLAVRVLNADCHGDLLLASTGTGVLGRYLLLPRRDAATEYASLMPYRTPQGPAVLLARCSARTAGDRRPHAGIELFVATPTGPWQPFGRIELDPAGAGADPPVSFDPLLNAVPGLAPYPWARRLREGAYAAARSSRE